MHCLPLPDPKLLRIDSAKIYCIHYTLFTQIWSQYIFNSGCGYITQTDKSTFMSLSCHIDCEGTKGTHNLGPTDVNELALMTSTERKLEFPGDIFSSLIAYT